MNATFSPPLREPKTHNHLLGDIPALEEAWERDGYWLFRDVLDKGAVARLRRVYTEELEKLGVIDPVGDAPTDRSVPYNGGSLDDYPRHMEPLARRKAWQGFVAEKPIHDFFVHLFGDEPFWVPYTEYRATPPIGDPKGERFMGIHQDGPNTPGVAFRTVWFPVAEIDRDIGGIVFAEGITDPINRHPRDAKGGNQMIPLDDLPDARWCHTTYRPGDVLMINRWTPHGSMTNVSDRFRLSFDHRVMKRSEPCPIVGEIVSMSLDSVDVRDANGVSTFRIQPDTYARNTLAQRLRGDDMIAHYPPGTPVILGHENGVATVIRPPHSA